MPVLQSPGNRPDSYGNWDGGRGHQFQDQPLGVHRPSGVYSTSLPQLNPPREFKERTNAIQRGGQQASGYYNKSIRNDDVRGTNLGMLTEETSASSPNVRDYQRYPDVANPQKQWHPIQRGKTQASGSFHRTIPNDDPVTSPPPSRPPLNSSQRPFSYVNGGMPQNEGEPERDQKKDYYWNFPGKAVDVVPGSQRPEFGGQADQVRNTKVLDRVFEWEPSNEDLSNTRPKVPMRSPPVPRREPPEALYQNQNPEVLLQPRTLLPRPSASPPIGRNSSPVDRLYMNQAEQPRDNVYMNQTLDPFNSFPPDAIGGPFDPRSESPPPGQTSAPVNPSSFFHDNTTHQQSSFFTLHDLKNKEKRAHHANVILTVVVVLCFLLAAAVVVILVEGI